MTNPEFIQKIKEFYSNGETAVEGSACFFVEFKEDQMIFRNKAGVRFYVAIDLIDKARTRHLAHQRIMDRWMRKQGNTNSYVPKILKCLVAQFP